MATQRQIFFSHQAQTTDFPLAIEMRSALGNYIEDINGKRYLDLISGISVSNIGHRHPHVVDAIKRQVDTHMHLLVYGEFIQAPQTRLAEKLISLVPPSLSSVYFVNSGSEALEGAVKLAKRATGRPDIIHFDKSYHGSSQGALSLIGDEHFSERYRPLVPGVKKLTYNSIPDLHQIDHRTAAVVIEPVQGEAGYVPATREFLEAIRKRCDQTGALLIFDEIQTGIGRTGKFLALEHYGVDPDILLLAKGLGGGMPIGAFLASKELMDNFKENPLLGHITTFGGHPVSAAAALATLEVLENEDLLSSVQMKEALFHERLLHEEIHKIRGKGLMLSVQMKSFEFLKKVIDRCLEKGLITDWFLFNDSSMRIAPPLTITIDEIHHACDVILSSIEEVHLSE